jgi:hypothetical protein
MATVTFGMATVTFGMATVTFGMATVTFGMATLRNQYRELTLIMHIQILQLGNYIPMILEQDVY